MMNSFARQFFRLCYGYAFYLLFMELFVRTIGEPGISWVVLLVMAGIYAGNYLLRNAVQRIWPLIPFTVLVCVGIWFLLPESTLQRSLLMGLAIGLMFSGFRFIRSGGLLPPPMDIPWPVFLLGLMATVFGLVYKVEGLVPLAAVLTGVALLFFLLILYADNTRNYMDSTRDIKGVPIHQMLKMNSWIIVGIFLCMVVAILLGEVLHLPDAFVRFGEALVSLLKTVFFGTLLVFQWIGQLFSSSSSQTVHNTARRLRQEVEEGNAFANILEVVLKLLFVALVVFVIIRILSRFLKSLSKKYHRSHGGAEHVTETAKTDVRTRIGVRNPFQRMKNYLSMEERARRIYRKRILECRKDRVPTERETTKDILETLRDEEGIELSELTELYNAVRYGGVIPDRAYLSRMRKACRS